MTDRMTGWVWPVLRHADGRAPRISSGWGSPRPGTVAQEAHSHRGVDVMYRRPRAVGAATFEADHGSKWYELPEGSVIVAPHDATVWSVTRGKLGIAVVLDHGAPWATFHQHLASASVKKGQRVITGEVLGLAGYGTIGSIRHLHFEVWRGGGGSAAVDPEPLMRSWGVLERPTRGRRGVSAELIAALAAGIGFLA